MKNAKIASWYRKLGFGFDLGISGGKSGFDVKLKFHPNKDICYMPTSDAHNSMAAHFKAIYKMAYEDFLRVRNEESNKESEHSKHELLKAL